MRGVFIKSLRSNYIFIRAIFLALDFFKALPYDDFIKDIGIALTKLWHSLQQDCCTLIRRLNPVNQEE